MFKTSYKQDDESLLLQLEESLRYHSFINEANDIYNLPVSILWGIGSRESHWGLLLKPPGPRGTGDWVKRPKKFAYRTRPLPPDSQGFGRGLMQIDYDAHEFARTGSWQDAKLNILYGAKVLSQNRRFIKRKTNIEGNQLLQAAIAAYNCGARWVLYCIEDNKDIDHYTAHQDYSKDVLNRAGWFELYGWGIKNREIQKIEEQVEQL